MTKREYYNKIERHYVYDGWSVDRIVKAFDISRRTIFYWKKKYLWDEKQAKYLSAVNEFKIDLSQFKRKLLNKISNNLDSKNINQEEIYALMNMLKC